jgi:hypothetical protein
MPQAFQELGSPVSSQPHRKDQPSPIRNLALSTGTYRTNQPFFRQRCLPHFDKSAQKCSNIATSPLPMSRSMPPAPTNRRGFLLWLLLPSLTACRTPAPLPPVDLTRPGWQVRRGQAVWLASSQGTELAGDLLFASHPDGQIILEFTKASWPLVVVRVTSNGWQFNSASTGQSRSGRGSPPSRSAWLVLPRCLAGAPAPTGWKFAHESQEGWRLEHRRTGEQVYGFLLP